MANNLLSKVSGAMAASARRVSRATRRLLRSRSVRKGKTKEAKTAGGGDGEAAVWHRSILLGQRCEPLDFSGAIHYDGQGRRLSQPRPRGGMASATKQQLQAATALICRSADVVDEAAITASKRSAAINGCAALLELACDDPSTAGAGGGTARRN